MRQPWPLHIPILFVLIYVPCSKSNPRISRNQYQFAGAQLSLGKQQYRDLWCPVDTSNSIVKRYFRLTWYSIVSPFRLTKYALVVIWSVFGGLRGKSILLTNNLAYLTDELPKWRDEESLSEDAELYSHACKFAPSIKL